MEVKQLTEEQRAAVETTDRISLLIAPAGSGKTEVLAQRVERLLSESTGESFRILAVTFTLKAAEELKRRLQSSSGQEVWRIDADTIHGMALGWLRRFGGIVGIQADVIVYAEQTDRLETLRRFAESLLGQVDDRELLSVLAHIDNVRTNLGYPDDEAIAPESLVFGIPFRDVLDAYSGALDRAGGIDFPGILAKMIELTDVDASAARRFQRTYRHVLVDEGQDLTRAQAEVLRRLVGDDVALFVVADDRQSINAWAGGGMEWARHLVGANATTLELRHNFRCATEILQLASRVAQNFSPPRVDATQLPGAARGVVTTSSATDESSEAVEVRDWVERLLTIGLPMEALVPGESPVIRPEEIAIIARTRYALDATQTKLVESGFQVSVQSDAASLLTSPVGRLLHAFLEVREKNGNRPALRRIEEELYNLMATPTPLSLDYSALADLVSASNLPAVLKETFRVPINGEGLDSFFARISPPDPSVGPDVLRMREWWAEYRTSTEERDRSLSGYLAHVLRVQQTRPDEPGIRLLTAHRAKGLEFRAVSLIGLTEGNFPDFRAVTDRDVDAERRVFYVSVTRASRALQITWPRTRETRFGTRSVRPSRFLTEAGLL